MEKKPTSQEINKTLRAIKNEVDRNFRHLSGGLWMEVKAGFVQELYRDSFNHDQRSDGLRESFFITGAPDAVLPGSLIVVVKTNSESLNKDISEAILKAFREKFVLGEINLKKEKDTVSFYEVLTWGPNHVMIDNVVLRTFSEEEAQKSAVKWLMKINHMAEIRKVYLNSRLGRIELENVDIGREHPKNEKNPVTIMESILQRVYLDYSHRSVKIVKAEFIPEKKKELSMTVKTHEEGNFLTERIQTYNVGSVHVVIEAYSKQLSNTVAKRILDEFENKFIL